MIKSIAIGIRQPPKQRPKQKQSGERLSPISPGSRLAPRRWQLASGSPKNNDKSIIFSVCSQWGDSSVSRVDAAFPKLPWIQLKKHISQIFFHENRFLGSSVPHNVFINPRIHRTHRSGWTRRIFFPIEIKNANCRATVCFYVFCVFCGQKDVSYLPSWVTELS